MKEITLNVAGVGNDGGMLVRLDDVKDMFQSQAKRIAELERALRWSRDNNTGNEPSVSVMNRYYDDLIPKEQGE